MCQHCQEAMATLFGHLPEQAQLAILWEYTCFPFGTHEQVIQHLHEFKAHPDPGYYEHVMSRGSNGRRPSPHKAKAHRVAMRRYAETTGFRFIDF